MKRMLFLICAVAATVALHAQSDEEQVLVFRHSGEVNLFYASRLDSITLSVYDADSVLHDGVVSQVFHSQDTTMFVPIAEIDSVAFGSRNAIEMHPGVKELTAETDLPWILRFDGESIFYRLNTPANILPQVGERLFYGLDDSDPETAVFPYGLTAKATAVTTLSDEIRVDVEHVELNEIFSKLFYAGYLGQQKEVTVKPRRAHGEGNLGFGIPMPEVGSIEVRGSCTVDGPITFNPLARRIAFDLEAVFSFGLDVKLEAEENTEVNYESFDGHYKTIATLYKVLNVGLAAGAFADLNASLTLDLGLERNFHRRVKYDRKGNDVKWEFPDVPAEEQTTDKTGVDLTLDGSIFFGPVVGLEVATIGELLGARAKLKVGPKYEGKVSMGFVKEAQKYNPEVYGSATLEACNRVALEGYIINRHNLVWGEVDEHKILDCSFDMNKHTIHLFPEFQQTRSVEAIRQTESEVTVSTVVDEEIPHELELGFLLEDEDGEVLDSVFVEDPILPDTTMVQGFEASFELPKRTDPDEHPLFVRPVFHYAGCTIPYKNVNVLHDCNIMPITAYGTNGVATYISGASVIGSLAVDSLTYHIGNYLPVPQQDSIFMPEGGFEPKIPGRPVDDDKKENLIGTWIGEVDGDMITLTFNDDDEQTGVYVVGGKQHDFTFSLNNPQSGDVRLLLNDQQVVIFTIVSVSDTTLVIRKKNGPAQFTLNKQY